MIFLFIFTLHCCLHDGVNMNFARAVERQSGPRNNISIRAHTTDKRRLTQPIRAESFLRQSAISFISYLTVIVNL